MNLILLNSFTRELVRCYSTQANPKLGFVQIRNIDRNRQMKPTLAFFPPLGRGKIVPPQTESFACVQTKMIPHCGQLSPICRAVKQLLQNQDQITGKLAPQTMHSFPGKQRMPPPPSPVSKCDQPRQSVWGQQKRAPRQIATMATASMRLDC